MQAKLILFIFLCVSLQSTVSFSSDSSSSKKLSAQQHVTLVFTNSTTSPNQVPEKLKRIMEQYPDAKEVKVYDTIYMKTIINQERETWIALPKLLIPKPEPLETEPVKRTNPLNDVQLKLF
ncbi:MAG: hypothetical protein WC747_01015 [Candidatus Babeliales bacterium]|jgi:hypothetical protein